MERGFEKQITKDLILRVAHTEEEGKRLARFNADIHGEELLEYIERLYFEHPIKEKILWFYIEDTGESPQEDDHQIQVQEEKTEEDDTEEQQDEAETVQLGPQIVSAMTLLPLEWTIRGHRLHVAEMGFVGTSPSHRGQGLFGIMNDYFDLAVKEGEYVLSALVGIPYFYRKYGYEFALLSRNTGYSMPTNNIPQQEIEHIKVRKAHEDDLDDIEKFYTIHYSKYGVCTVFDKKNMAFRLMNNTADTINSLTYIIEEDRKSVGFFSIGSLHDPKRADIILSSELTKLQMIKVLQFVKAYNMGNINAFNVSVDKESRFAQYLKSRGADPVRDWLWQVRIPDLHSFMEALAPVIEERLADSMFRNISQTLKISDYTETLSLTFEHGRITEIETERGFPSSDVDLRMPAPYNIRLFLSDRSFDEISNIVSDAIVKADSELLIETIFPKFVSLAFSYYQ